MENNEETERVPELVWDFALLLVRLDKNSGITNKVRVPLGQDELHCLWVDEGDKTKHTLLLVWNPHVLHRPIDASQKQN